MPRMMQAGANSPAWSFETRTDPNPYTGVGGSVATPVRGARIAALQRTIAAGTYRVSSIELAEKMIPVMVRRKCGIGRPMQN